MDTNERIEALQNQCSRTHAILEELRAGLKSISDGLGLMCRGLSKNHEQMIGLLGDIKQGVDALTLFDESPEPEDDDPDYN